MYFKVFPAVTRTTISPLTRRTGGRLSWCYVYKRSASSRVAESGEP